MPIGVFAERIAAARRDQELLLTDSERRVLEDALLTQLARQIHERTIDARDLIARMNREMQRPPDVVGDHGRRALGAGRRACPTSSARSCGLLERDAAQLGPDELARMRGHFAGSIKAARAAKPDRAYRELLGEVLDYRRWRTFAFFLHPAGRRRGAADPGPARAALRRRAVGVAAPAAVRRRARHVRLGEHRPARGCWRSTRRSPASTTRAAPSCSGWPPQFDLDLFMTGYDLWATYATVPAGAHYDLSHSAVEHAVSALLMVWDGQGHRRRRRRRARGGARVAADPAPSRNPARGCSTTSTPSSTRSSTSRRRSARSRRGIRTGS